MVGSNSRSFIGGVALAFSGTTCALLVGDLHAVDGDGTGGAGGTGGATTGAGTAGTTGSGGHGTMGSGGAGTGGTPVVTDVMPLVVTLNQLTTFTIDGSGMPSTTAAYIANCANLVVTSVTAKQAEFQCTPSYFTGLQGGVVKDKPGGTVLYTFSVNVN
jgi:hypothetical protein